MTGSKLRSLVQASREDLPGRLGDVLSGRITVRAFTLDEEQLKTVTLALAEAKAAAGTDLDSVALQHVARDYLGPSTSLAERHLKGIGLLGALSLLERCFPEADLKIEANRPQGDQEDL
jgi:hypothetical protein